MTIIGQGMMRACCDCFIIIGCYQPDGSQHDCEKCHDEAICPDTQDTSHGICDLCLERARERKKAKERK